MTPNKISLFTGATIGEALAMAMEEKERLIGRGIDASTIRLDPHISCTRIVAPKGALTGNGGNIIQPGTTAGQRVVEMEIVPIWDFAVTVMWHE